MELSRQQKVAYGLVAVLAVVFLGMLVYLQISKGRERVVVPPPATVTVEGLASSVAARPFDTAVLRDSRYQALDRSLIDQGRLPVPPPATRGKPNLF